MKKQTTNPITTDQEPKQQVSHYSDGSELIPSEIKSDPQSHDNLVAGYTRDDEGITNNYALEPAISSATYPDSEQQVRYLFWGIGAILFVGVILFIAFSIS